MASAEIDRAAALWDAQLKADALFAEIERDQLIRTLRLRECAHHVFFE